MIEIALALALAGTQVDQTDLPPAPAPAVDEVDADAPKRIFVKDSSQAARVKVEFPMQQICVRKPVIGSRVKSQTVCQDQASWKAYMLAQAAEDAEWGNARRGIDVKD